MSSAELLQATLPAFLIIAVGMLLRRTGRMPAAADGALMHLAINVTYPCLIIHSLLVRKSTLQGAAEWLTPFLCGIGLPLAGIGIAWIMAPLFRVRVPLSRRCFAFTASLQNYGYLPIPILIQIFPGREWMTPLFVYTLGIELVVWTVGVLMLGGGRGAWRRVFNPVVASVLLGIAAQWSGLAGEVPAGWTWLLTLMEMLGHCAFPLGLMMIGVALYDLIRGGQWRGEWLPAAGGTIVRMGVLPVIFWAAIRWLPVSADLRHVLAVQAAMPAAMFPIIIARTSGGDESLVTRIVIATTVLSVATIPFVLPWTLRW